MQMMDVMVMPSFHEGLPVVGIEAQAAGLCCVFADTITKEVKIIDSCKFVSLMESASEWAEQILSLIPNQHREIGQSAVVIAGYNIANVSDYLFELYCLILGERATNG